MSGDERVVPLHAVPDAPDIDAGDAANAAAEAADSPAVTPVAGSADAGHPGHPGHSVVPATRPPGWEQRLADGLAFLRRRIEGDYQVDEFGFDEEFATGVALPAFRALYDRWFRVEVNGVSNIPDTGAALLVGNHAGGIVPLDAAMTAVAVHREHPRHRFLRPLAADLLLNAPGLGQAARRSGATTACRADANRLLRAGELVGVWPEGFKGIGKPYRDRYRLQRFGRGGFVRSAIAAQAPIVPVSIVGSEEIHPVLADAPLLARLFDLPYFPITPTFPWLGALGLVPLPSKWYIEFGAPIHTDRMPTDAADDPAQLFELTDRVRSTIQTTLYRLLSQRRSVWR